jgi:hypothetical protein
VSAIDLAALILAAVALVAVAALALVCARLVRVVNELRDATTRFEASALPAAHELTDAARSASTQVDRLDDLIRTTGNITSTVDNATQATFKALSNPVIKGAAIASGTSRAAKRLRGGSSQRPGGGSAQRKGA